MIISMCEVLAGFGEKAERVICVTNRALCREDFLARIAKLAAARPRGIILREKDLSAAEYEDLARRVLPLCEAAGVTCVLHSFPEAARRLGCGLHLPLPALRALSEEERRKFAFLGASCHSVAEAVEAEWLGCAYVTAGHVFATDCKRGVPPRGLEFLRAVAGAVRILVYAIGGVRAENFASVCAAGAAGACVMSAAMRDD